MRKIIADHMKTSLETSAHVHVVNEVNMTAIANYINEKNTSFEEQEGFSLTTNSNLQNYMDQGIQEKGF